MKINEEPAPRGRKKSLSVSERVSLDLASYLENFPNKCFAIRVLAKESGLNEKTIKRLLAKNNKPTYQTIFRLYSVFLNTTDYDNLIEKSPKVIKETLKKYSPCESLTQESKNQNFLEYIKKEPLMAELYILAGTGPLVKNAIGFRYGQYGLEVLEKLVEAELIVKVDKDTYIISKSAPNLDGDCLKHLGEYFVHRFSKPRNAQLEGENTIAFYAEGLNDAGLKEWLKVDSEAFYKKQQIADQTQYKGNIPVFSFSATDTIQLEKNNA
jgi:acyl-CoA-binding protein